MIKRIITLLIFTLMLSNMAWATSFEGLNCHDQGSTTDQSMGQSIDRISDHEPGDTDHEEHCCDCNILVLPNLHLQNNNQEPDKYLLTVVTKAQSRFYQPPVPPPTV